MSGTLYSDRHAAGFKVAELLYEKYSNSKALVVGIPRGGVVIAYEISRLLNIELSVIITKKLPHPEYEEIAIGALAEDGTLYLTKHAGGISKNVVHGIIDAQGDEIRDRVDKFRDRRPLPAMEHRTVIIADDGIATGSTIVPAIKLCRRRRADYIIVVAPVSGGIFDSEISRLADEVIIAEQPDGLSFIAEAYDDFHQATDEEVIALLRERER